MKQVIKDMVFTEGFVSKKDAVKRIWEACHEQTLTAINELEDEGVICISENSKHEEVLFSVQ